MISDLTEQKGRFFAPTAPWNEPLRPGPVDLDATRRFGRLTTVSLSVGPLVVHVRDVGNRVQFVERDGDGELLRTHVGRLPVGFAPHGDLVIIDHQARTIVSGRGWHWNTGRGRYDVEGLDIAALDGVGWGSPALGLVLERELLSGEIHHAVGLWVPLGLQCYGATVMLRQLRHRPYIPAARTVAAALQTYGGIVVGIHDGTVAVVRVEQSAAASAADPVGPTYRQLGLSGEHTSLGLDVADLEVLS